MPVTARQRSDGTPRVAHDRLRIDAAGWAGRRTHLPWIAIGLVVVVGFGLAGAVTLARVADREPVLALALPMERGEVLTAEHLTEVSVGTDDAVSVVAAARRDELMGLVALAPLGRGTLISPDHFATSPVLAAGEAVVGLALAPGEYPTVSLRPGDRVVVVRVPDPTGPTSEATVLAQDVEVWAVEPLSDTARTLMVSVAVPSGVAPEIAAAAARGRVRLLLVGSP